VPEERAQNAGPSTRIATRRNALGATDLRIADLLLERPADVVEMTAQQLADAAGVARSSVVRLCQALGYRGFPQLRVSLATELAQRFPDEPQEPEPGEGALAAMRRSIAGTGRLLPELTAMLDREQVEAAVGAIAGARRMLVLATGLSSPLGMDLAMRLTAQGRPAEYVHDGLAQQIAAQGLQAGDCAVAVSASGASRPTVAAARAAADAGAAVVSVTSFQGSPLGQISTHGLIVAGAGSFRDELEQTSRVPHAVFLEALVRAVVERRGGAWTRARVFDALGEHLVDDAD
jgi:DNA-binding MurR/RpiR family transcriptional regulator